MSDDLKNKINSLKSLKSEVTEWKRESIRERAGKKAPEPEETPQEDVLGDILKKIGK